MKKTASILALLAASVSAWPAEPLAAQSTDERRYLSSDFDGPGQGPGAGIWSRADFDATWQAVRSVPEAISVAAEATTIDYEFLLAQAYLESAMNPGARARTSSATGLFQFINSTWIRTVGRHGARFGLDDWAELIAASSHGNIGLADARLQRQLLDLRKDPLIASIMAAGLAEDNREALVPVLRREPTYTELYLAHFLGAGAATRFVRLMQHHPGVSAAAQFPRAARANRAIFYERGGEARSIAGVKTLFDRKIDGALRQVRHHVEARPYRLASVSMASRISRQQTPTQARAYLSVDEDVYAAPGQFAQGSR